MPEWIGIVQTTTSQFLKGAENNTLRKRILLAMAKKRGRVTTGGYGKNLVWDVMFDQPPAGARSSGSQVNFTASDCYRQMELDWKEYFSTDFMSEKDTLMNSGTAAIVNRYTQIMPNMVTRLDELLNSELYVDGYAAGNELKLNGFDSFTGVGTTIAADLIAQPSDNYGGRSTVLGSEGGSWSTELSTKPNNAVATDWPEGTGSVSYDYITPKLVNWSSSSWGTSAQTWLANCEVSLRQARIWSAQTGGIEGVPELAVMTGKMYREFGDKQSSKSRIVVPHSEAEDLGFSDTLNFEGMTLAYEYGVPVNSCYGFNIMEMEYRVLGGQFYINHGPEWSPESNGYTYKIGHYGNLKFNPKAQFKLKNYAA